MLSLKNTSCFKVFDVLNIISNLLNKLEIKTARDSFIHFIKDLLSELPADSL
jgi:hypothetical protein